MSWPTDDDRSLVEDGCISVKEAKDFLGISRSKLYEHMDAGEIPFAKVGRRRLVPKRALKEFLASRLQGR